MVAKRQKHKAQSASAFNTATTQFSVLHQLAFGGLALILLLSPYFRGLFFAPEQGKALIAVTLVFGLTSVWCWLQNQRQLPVSLLDYWALALPVVYIAAVITAVNKGLALDEVVKYLLYFLTYWCVSRLIRQRQDITKILQVIYISAVGVALVGLGVATELVYVKDGFLNGRIYSTFQYPNALASLLGVVFLIGLYLWFNVSSVFNDDNRQSQSVSLTWDHLSGYLYAGGNFLLLAVLWGTKSRGGLLVFGLVFLFYLLGLGARRRLAITLHTGYMAVVAYISISQFIKLALAHQYGLAWLWILAALVVVWVGQLALQQLSQFAMTRLRQNQVTAKVIDNKLNQLFGLLAAIGMLGTVLFVYIKADLWAKIANFSYLRNAFERMYFVHDAISMIKDRPLLGWGGGGWKEAYRFYQNYFYNSNEVHSYYFQVGVETGILGLVAILGLWLTFGYYVFKLYQKAKLSDPQTIPLVWLLASCFLMMATHACIDFDLSLSALTLVLWTVLGIVNYLYQAQQPASSKEQVQVNATKKPVPFKDLNKIPLLISFIAVVTIIVPTIFSVQAQAHAKQARLYIDARQIAIGAEHLEKAVRLHPWHPTFRDMLAQVYLAQGKTNLALEQAERAVQLGSYNDFRRVILADAYLATGQEQKAIEQVEKAVALAPYVQKRYEDLTEKYFGVGYNAFYAGRQDEAQKYLQKIVSVPKQIENVMNDVPATYRQMWRDGPYLTATPPILFCVGAANYQLGNFEQAKITMQQLLDQKETMYGQVWVWLALVADKQGRAHEVPGLLQKAAAASNGKATLSEVEEGFNHMKEQPILIN